MSRKPTQSDHVPRERIRNFSIIAHIDHGKSTLADRLLELTHTVDVREQRAQYMDKMDLERERGITIKSQSARLSYTAADGLEYQLNLIDTPGHVDFNYEVSRSLKACEGALLVVDASQGVEAQTLANVYLALEENLEIIVVLNKIDLSAVDVECVRAEIEDTIGLDTTDSVAISAKSGIGIADLLEAIVTRLPPPKGDPTAPTRGLVFDSWYDAYRGVIAMVRMFDGTLKKGEKIRLMATEAEHELLEVGVNQPEMKPVPDLLPGEVGYIVCGLKDIRAIRVGDTITTVRNPATQALPGFKPAQQMVFSGIFPVEGSDFEPLRDALSKLSLNDAAISFEPESSSALGFGFRVGFLGLLHMEIVQERLEREFDMDLVITAPSVVYRITMMDGSEMMAESPKHLPNVMQIKEIGEPIARAIIHTPQEYLGAIIKLCEEKRGRQKNLQYAGPTRVLLTYEMPLAEIIMDFFDKLKTSSRGYASLDYEVIGFNDDDLVKVDILVNNESVDALACIMHRSQAEYKGRQLCEKLKEILPKQQFEIPIQAAIGARIVARATIKSVGKNVTAKCYGGDISRKRKLLDKQKEGKKRMKQFGKVEIPQDAFMAILKVD